MFLYFKFHLTISRFCYIVQMSKKILQPFQSVQSLSAIGNSEFEITSERKSNNKLKNEYTIKINAPQGQLNMESILLSENAEQNNKKIITKNPFNTQTTGYDINRELFSDDDIRQAFNIIDFNNDGYLSPEEISFFLSCMDQPHSCEQVEEMIRMISKDNKRVIFQDFKKIGKGKIPPFAAIRPPDPLTRNKQIILENMQQSSLMNLQPEELIQLKEQLNITYQNFKEENTNQKNIEKKVQPLLIIENRGMNLRTQKEIKQKREQFSKVTMLNVQKAVEALQQLQQQIIDVRCLTECLAISQLQAKTLFDQNKKLIIREVIMDVILFSNSANLTKLWLILLKSDYPKTIDLDQWLNILCFMMGVDQKNFIRKRLEKIIKYRKIDLSSKFQNHFIMQVMTEQFNLFLW